MTTTLTSPTYAAGDPNWSANGSTTFPGGSVVRVLSSTGQASSFVSKTALWVDGLDISCTINSSGGADAWSIGVVDSTNSAYTYCGAFAGSGGLAGSGGYYSGVIGNFYSATYIKSTYRMLGGSQTDSGTTSVTTTGSHTWRVQFTLVSGSTYSMVVSQDASVIQTYTVQAPANGYVIFGGGSGGVGSTTDVSSISAATVDAPITVVPVVTSVASNGAVWLSWTSSPGATSYDVYDGASTVNYASSPAYQTGYTNGTPVTFTVTPKNDTYTGTAGSTTATPSSTVLLFDTFSRTATPPGNPDYGPAPSVQTTVTADGNSCRSTGTGDSFIIWDVTSTDLIQIDVVIWSVDSSTPEFCIVDSYTDTSNYSYWRWSQYIYDRYTASHYRKVAGTYNLDVRNTVLVYDEAVTGLRRDVRAGDLITVRIHGDVGVVFYNGVPTAEWTVPRAANSKVGLRFNGSTSWAVDRIVVSTFTDTVAGFVYKGRTSADDTGSAA